MKTEFIRVRVSKETKEELEREAHEFGCSSGVVITLSQHIRAILDSRASNVKRQREAGEWIKENPLGNEKTKRVSVRRIQKGS
jgi:hypothetical protein